MFYHCLAVNPKIIFTNYSLIKMAGSCSTVQEMSVFTIQNVMTFFVHIPAC